MTEKEFYQGIRQICLSIVDLLERKLGMEPRTAEIRKWYKESTRPEQNKNS